MPANSRNSPVPDSIPPADITAPPASKVTGIREKVEERKRLEAAALGETAKPAESIITAKLVKDCLIANEMGDGMLYAALHRGHFVFNKTSLQWLAWAGHHWQMDEMDASFAAVEDVAVAYLDAGYELKEKIDAALSADKKDEADQLKTQQKTYFARVKKLRSVSGVSNCLTYSHKIKEPLAVKEAFIDKNPWLLAFSNGVVDLRSGKFRPGAPEDYLLKAVPHEWKGIDAPSPLFDAFLESALDGAPNLTEEERRAYREALIGFVLRALGYGITGLNIEHMFLVFNGAGRNGKGVLVELLRYVLGALAGPIAAEMLLDQGRARSSNGPSPDIMSLKGMRIAFASETDEGRRFAPGQIKWYTGGDTLQGRYPHDKRPTDFEPTHLLILLTNNLPHAPGDDFAFWNRLNLIPFLYSFVADPDPAKPEQKQRDGKLLERLKGEAPGILARLVRGCLEWQQQGLNPPECVTMATEEYRANEDTITQFVEECCICSGMSEVKAGDIYRAFATWYESQIGDRVPKQKKFGSMLVKQFQKEKVGGVIKYYGLELKGDHQPEL